MSNRRKFLKQLGLNSAGLMILPGLHTLRPSPASNAFPHSALARNPLDRDPFAHNPLARGAGPFPRSTPEQQGIASASILDFLAAIQSGGQEFHSIMIIRHGHVVAEGWWAPFTKDD